MKTLTLAIFTIAFIIPSLVFAQQPGQQQMQQMTQKMNDLMKRTHVMNQEMNHQMQQMQDEQMKKQYQMMYRFNEQLQMAIGNMKNAAERCDLMMQNKEIIHNEHMQREMNRLQKHLGEMSEQAEEAVKTMERLTKRIHQQETVQANDNN